MIDGWLDGWNNNVFILFFEGLFKKDYFFFLIKFFENFYYYSSYVILYIIKYRCFFIIEVKKY